MMVTHTLVFALSLVMLYSLPSDLLCMCTPSIEFLKVCFTRREKRMLKRVGARTQPCFTPLMIRWLPSYHHEKIWSCCEASEDIRALGGCWRAYSRLPGKRPRSDPWRQCRGAFAVPCTSTIVAEGEKSCPLWNVLLENHIWTLCRRVPPAVKDVLTGIWHTVCPRCSRGRCLWSCCSRSYRLFLYRMTTLSSLVSCGWNTTFTPTLAKGVV